MSITLFTYRYKPVVYLLFFSQNLFGRKYDYHSHMIIIQIPRTSTPSRNVESSPVETSPHTIEARCLLLPLPKRFTVGMLSLFTTNFTLIRSLCNGRFSGVYTRRERKHGCIKTVSFLCLRLY